MYFDDLGKVRHEDGTYAIDEEAAEFIWGVKSGNEFVTPVIVEHLNIFRKFHEPFGISLSESKEDWLILLDQDPEMNDEFKWGNLAGSVSIKEVGSFRSWLTEGKG